MKRNKKSLTFFDLFLILAAVLLLSVVAYTAFSGEEATVQEATVRIDVRYRPITAEEPLPKAGDALMDGRGRSIGEVISASAERDGTVFLQGRIQASRLPEKGETVLLETRTMIREASVTEAYVEEAKHE
ncbi:MAG: hypothetical protein IJC84_01720 [Clostridia bacterium]|nr:hypothetical protein [Clostridia bacterium]